MASLSEPGAASQEVAPGFFSGERGFAGVRPTFHLRPPMRLASSKLRLKVTAVLRGADACPELRPQFRRAPPANSGAVCSSPVNAASPEFASHFNSVLR